MKKILPNSSLRNRRLRERGDLSPLLKTYIHRWHYQSTQTFDKWVKMLSDKDKTEIEKSYGKKL